MKNAINLLAVLVLFTSCQVKLNKNQTLKNENIPFEIQSEISKLDNRIVDAIKINQPEKIHDILSPKLVKEDESQIDSIFNVTSKLLIDVDFKRLDYLYVINATKNVMNTIFSGLTDDNDYIIHYKALSKDIFISLYTAKFAPNEILMALIYGKTKKGWKLYHLQFGTYSIYGKTAIDYYKIAKRFDSLEYIVDAANNLFFAQQALKPGNQLWQYQKEKEIVDLQKFVMEKINRTYKFPLKIESIKTKPQIYHIYPQAFNDRFATTIKYYSHIDLKDTVQLKIENLEIQKIIGEVFKGIDKEKDYLIYQASNELPDGTYRQIPIYGFVQEFKNEK